MPPTSISPPRTPGDCMHTSASRSTRSDSPLQPAADDRDELLSTLAAIAAHSPANIAYRSLTRVLSPGHKVSDVGLWEAAATLAAGLRSLFNRLDSTLLLDKLYGTAEPYWRTVLRYCADGNLQAVLDEYLHHLRSEESTVVMDDERLMALARRARDAVSMRPSRYESFDPDDPSQPISFRSRFALRYGSKRHDVESARQPQVRNAFNSPFWPFVLTTTSVGQEGIDFHWWCHAVVHWNLPANPVDFEQREGRVNRFGGHAVRRNIAARHRASVMTSQEADPWKAAYDAARDQSAHLGEFAPYWIYPGSFKVERQLINYPLSRDTAKVVALKDDLALYRLAFGQPRQEDLLDFLKRRGVDGAGTAGIDLRPDAIRPRNHLSTWHPAGTSSGFANLLTTRARTGPFGETRMHVGRGKVWGFPVDLRLHYDSPPSSDRTTPLTMRSTPGLLGHGIARLHEPEEWSIAAYLRKFGLTPSNYLSSYSRA